MPPFATISNTIAIHWLHLCAIHLLLNFLLRSSPNFLPCDSLLLVRIVSACCEIIAHLIVYFFNCFGTITASFVKNPQPMNSVQDIILFYAPQYSWPLWLYLALIDLLEMLTYHTHCFSIVYWLSLEYIAYKYNIIIPSDPIVFSRLIYLKPRYFDMVCCAHQWVKGTCTAYVQLLDGISWRFAYSSSQHEMYGSE